MSSWLVNKHRKSSLNINTEIVANNLYVTSVHRIEQFNNNITDALITFIIPTINRNTLTRALLSLQNQIITNWKAIIVFDGCKPTDTQLLKLLSNDRFLYISVNKIGVLKNIIHGAAGFVRNIGMELVKTPWIGFLDDDDYLLPNYTQYLLEEIEINPLVDLILFRMIDNNIIIPPEYITDIQFRYVGISFCYKTSIFKEGHKFIQSEKEDFELINNIKNAQKKIVISPFITYIVRDSDIICDTLKRVIIN